MREAGPGIRRLARIGFAAKGVVYLIIGWLALKAAIGTGGQTTDSAGALGTILRQPYGWALLGAVSIGLAGYAAWMFVRAGVDPEGAGGGLKGIAARSGYAISGAIHVALAVEAARMATGFSGGQQGDSGPQDWTALALAQPFGRWINDSLHQQAWSTWLLALPATGLIAYGLFGVEGHIGEYNQSVWHVSETHDPRVFRLAAAPDGGHELGTWLQFRPTNSETRDDGRGREMHARSASGSTGFTMK